MARKLEEYCIWGDLDTEKVRKLHEVVGNFKDRILTDKILQNVLYNRGYQMEGERPKNYCELNHVAFNARIASLALTYVNYIMDLATRPQITTIESPKIIIPGQDCEVKFSAQGQDALAVEELQRAWFENFKIVEIIRKYQGNLEKAMDEFSMQTILGKVNHARSNFISPGKEWKKEREIQRRIVDSWDAKSITALDNAYYNMAMRFYGALSKSWKELMVDEFGKKFVMTQEEVQKGIRI